MIPNLSDIEAAARRIKPYAVRTPLVESPSLSALTGGRVFLKLETLQRTGSFKFRGACNAVAQLSPEQLRGGVVAFSSGNHAQGVAAAAALFGAPALIVMPKDVPPAKLEGTRRHGAEVVFYDRVHDDREAIAARLCAERGATLIKPFDQAEVIAGQGTVGLEIAEDAARFGVEFDTVLVPCSGGGLASGTTLGLQSGAATSMTKVRTVEPEKFDGMKRSLEAGQRMTAPGGALSIADALMAPSPGEIVFQIARGRLGPGLAVDDASLARAVTYAATTLKLVVEPGGAAALAALLDGAVQEQVVAIVLSGANV
jgi:threonine dehydratase